MGRRRCSPISVFSTNIVGFVKISSYWDLPQCGHSFAFFAFSMICSGILFWEITVYAAAFDLILRYSSRSSWGTFRRVHVRHVDWSSLWMLSMNAMCRTGSASSICPKCPGQRAAVLPHVRHFWPGFQRAQPAVHQPSLDRHSVLVVRLRGGYLGHGVPADLGGRPYREPYPVDRLYCLQRHYIFSFISRRGATLRLCISCSKSLNAYATETDETLALSPQTLQTYFLCLMSW